MSDEKTEPRGDASKLWYDINHLGGYTAVNSDKAIALIEAHDATLLASSQGQGNADTENIRDSEHLGKALAAMAFNAHKNGTEFFKMTGDFISLIDKYLAQHTAHPQPDGLREAAYTHCVMCRNKGGNTCPLAPADCWRTKTILGTALAQADQEA